MRSPSPAPGGWRLHPRSSSSSKLTRRIISNVKVTLLCAFVTLLVLRGTVGVHRRLVYIADHTERSSSILRRDSRAADSDSDSDDPDSSAAPPSISISSSSSSPEREHYQQYDRGAAWTTANYSLGPRVTRWNAKRRRWLHQNPGFPSRDARRGGRPRVLLVTASPPGPCTSPIPGAGDHFLLRATKNRLDYCRLHGIEMVHAMDAGLEHDVDDPSPSSSSSGGWGKLALLRRLMLAHPEVEWLWWLDAAALVTDMGFELPWPRYQGFHFVVRGDTYQLFNRRAWDGASTASFLLRNCQWSLDLLDAWAVMAAPGRRARRDAGELLTATLEGRPAGTTTTDADDQSALVHLLVTERERWMDRVYLENQYYLHGVWTGLVGTKLEEAMENHHPGYGDDRWPFVTHFAGCDPSCDGGGENRSGGELYAKEWCVWGMERAFNFADDQVLRLYGFRHVSLTSDEVTRVENRSADPLEAKEEAMAFLKKPYEPDPWSSDVRKDPKRKTKGEEAKAKEVSDSDSNSDSDSDSFLARILRRLGWRS